MDNEYRKFYVVRLGGLFLAKMCPFSLGCTKIPAKIQINTANTSVPLDLILYHVLCKSPLCELYAAKDLVLVIYIYIGIFKNNQTKQLV